MIVIICAKYKKNPSRTVDAIERTRFSKSRPNYLENIRQGQRSLCATHPLMVVIICGSYGRNPSRTVDVTERTRQAGQTDGRTDGQTDGQTAEWNQYTPKQLRCSGDIIKLGHRWIYSCWWEMIMYIGFHKLVLIISIDSHQLMLMIC